MEGLDAVAENEKLLDLDLVVVGPDADAPAVLADGVRVLSILGPRVVVLDGTATADLPEILVEALPYTVVRQATGFRVLDLQDEVLGA